jgi:Fe-S cluster biogenesis protein NfuA
MTTFNASEFQAGLKRLDRLLQEAERVADPAVQARTRAIVQALLDLHAAGLGRLLDHLEEAGEAGRAVLDACASDEIVCGLLLLHGLHPLGVEERVRQALESVRPYLRSHGGNVELLGIESGVVRLQLEGSCHSCPSSAVTMKQTVEEAILARAPDVTAVAVEGMAEPMPAPSNSRDRVSLPLLGAGVS